MHAPIACIRGLPASTSRSKNPLRSGLNRAAAWVGRNSAFRSRGLTASRRRSLFDADKDAKKQARFARVRAVRDALPAAEQGAYGRKP